MTQITDAMLKEWEGLPPGCAIVTSFTAYDRRPGETDAEFCKRMVEEKRIVIIKGLRHGG